MLPSKEPHSSPVRDWKCWSKRRVMKNRVEMVDASRMGWGRKWSTRRDEQETSSWFRCVHIT